MTEAEQNLARIQATLRQMGINALQATPEQLARAKRQTAEMRASFSKFKILELETQGEYRARLARAS
jgi:hypothetical protein